MSETNVTWPGWETVRLIGRGSFGAVYEIQRQVRGRTEHAALKVISIPKGEEEILSLRANDYDDESITRYFADNRDKIEDEYAVMADMKGHANIVYCDDIRTVQHSDGFGWDIFIKMELLTPMKKYFHAEVPEEQVIRVGVDICNALVACKTRNIVHRDIKPDNIFVSWDGNFKLGDFGIARTMENTTMGTFTGTYEYMAPEIYQHQPYNSSADIYSLGLVMYWLLNGRTAPFLRPSSRRPTPSDLAMAREQRFSGKPLPAPVNGSRELQQIVLKACAYDSHDRYDSPEEMKEALEELSLNRALQDIPEESTVVNQPKVDADDEVTVCVQKEERTKYEVFSKAKHETKHKTVVKAERKTGWFALTVVLVCIVTGGLLVCLGTSGRSEKNYQEPAEQISMEESTSAATEATEGSEPALTMAEPVKTGLAIVTNVSGSESATYKEDGKAAYDLTIVAVTVDDRGVIRSCIIDGVSTSVQFDASGTVTSDIHTAVATKTELGENYGLGTWGGAIAEWDQQVAALASFAIGKTVEELRSGAIDETGRAPAGSDLASSATIYLGGFVSAIEQAAANAKYLGAQTGDVLKLATNNTVESSMAADDGDPGTAQLDSTVTVLTMNGDIITSCCIDAVQARVDFDASGIVTTDITAPVPTKNQLGEAYGMKNWGGAIAEWDEQAAAFAAYITGKTVADVQGIAVNGKTVPTDADLTSSVTISIGGFQTLVTKAARS